jgi:hypothetical protein
LQAGRKWDNIFKELKKNICRPRILYLAILFFRKIRTFLDNQKLGRASPLYLPYKRY